MTFSESSHGTLERIRAALKLPSRDATIHDVKRAVIDEFERVDRRVRIKSTEYFRHSYVPDLVLSWQDEIDRPERWVFLRSKVRADYLLADVALVARDQPIIFGLMPTEEAPSQSSAGGSDDAARLRERSIATGTLVTDPAGLDALSESMSESGPAPAVPELVARHILRGGRGVYDERSSTETASTISAGFVGAFAVDAESTFTAAATIRRSLGDRSGQPLLRLLHAIWVASGGRSDQFPDAPSASGVLTDDALELLLSGPEIVDDQFWRRLGTVTLNQLARLRVGDRPPNLARLVGVNADTVAGRWCRVVPDQARTGSDGALQWGVERHALALHGPSFTAYIAEEKRDLESVPAVEHAGTSVVELSQRAGRADAVISDVTAAGGGLIIGVASDTHAHVLDHPHAAESVGTAADNVTRATAMLRNGRTVTCDFMTATASSRTRATLTLRELVRHGLPLVWPLSDDEMSGLDSMLTAVSALQSAAPPQPSLFDMIDDGDEAAAESDAATED